MKVRGIKISLAAVGMLTAAFSIYLVLDDRALCRKSAYTVSCFASNPISWLLLDETVNAPFDLALEKIQTEPCSDIQLTAETLTVGAEIVPGNVHYFEEMSEAVDKILAKSPKCFLDATMRMKPAARAHLKIVIDSIQGKEYISKGKSELNPFRANKEYAGVLKDLN